VDWPADAVLPGLELLNVIMEAENEPFLLQHHRGVLQYVRQFFPAVAFVRGLHWVVTDCRLIALLGRCLLGHIGAAFLGEASPSTPARIVRVIRGWHGGRGQA